MVYRYECNVDDGMDVSKWGDYVLHSDYKDLEIELNSTHDTVDALAEYLREANNNIARLRDEAFDFAQEKDRELQEYETTVAQLEDRIAELEDIVENLRVANYEG